MAYIELDQEMEEPCLCDYCGSWFDLCDGNGCGSCNKVLCEKCLPDPFDDCYDCRNS